MVESREYGSVEPFFDSSDNLRFPSLHETRQRGDLDGNPMLVVFSSYVDLIRTLPVMQHDKDNPEDMDTDGKDHGIDDTRYACLSRPWARPTPQKTEGASVAPPVITLNDVVRATEMRRRNSNSARI
jgi:hypothetical protein